MTSSEQRDRKANYAFPSSLLVGRDRRRPLHQGGRPTGGESVLEMLRGKTVMVTGAGGTVGSELVRQVAMGGALRVVMVERSESALYEIVRAMHADGINAEFVPVMADVADERRLRSELERWHPRIVFHAAAYKHVPMVEANPLDGLRNNAIAPRRLGEWCRSAGAERFVLISSDKAVRPVSAMGMIQRLAEVLLLGINRGMEKSGRDCAFACVRFGNLLGSSGSVVPLFREQIARKGPVTVTHPDMKRYFLEVDETVELVLEAMALGGECVYTLDMGEPVRIVDLAENMIREAGLRPYVDVPIRFTGIRPGEKLFEAQDVGGDGFRSTAHGRVFECLESGSGDGVQFSEVESFAAGEPDDEQVREFLRRTVGAEASNR